MRTWFLIVGLSLFLSGCVNWYHHSDGSYNNTDDSGYVHKVHFP